MSYVTGTTFSRYELYCQLGIDAAAGYILAEGFIQRWNGSAWINEASTGYAENSAPASSVASFDISHSRGSSGLYRLLTYHGVYYAFGFHDGWTSTPTIIFTD